MGAESPRLFSEINTGKDAEFISYADVMHTLMQLRAKPLQEIAKELKQRRIHKRHAAYLSGPELAVNKTKNTGALKALLDETIISGRIAPAHYGVDGEIVKPYVHGWLHREFIFAMAMARLPWPVTPDMLAAVEERRAKQESESESSPEWTRPYTGRNRIPDPNPQPATSAEALAEIARLKAEVQRLTQKVGETEKHAQPTDDASKLTFKHSTSELEILAEAARAWWSNYDPADHTTAPTHDEVIPWLISKGITKRKALIMASILRPRNIPTGPR